MIHLEENVSLLPYNSFGINVRARLFCRITSVEQLQELIHSPVYLQQKKLILGGGSNVLFTHDFDGLLLKMEIKGIEVIDESDEQVVVRVGAGELWHDLVIYCVDRNWGGIENLSLIPGTVGAAPIQNIGAYGVEIAEVIKTVATIDATSGMLRTYTKDECAFGYRESAFKVTLKEKIFISSVTLTLTKKNHLYNISYGAIKDTLQQRQTKTHSVKEISNAVIEIRRSKLPDHTIIGNAGSFFKNPTLSHESYSVLRNEYPLIPSYPADNQNVKVPAGWLIEQCGWKGKRFHDAGVHTHQALVLVNYGKATGIDILQLAKQIQSSVKEKFNVSLTPEVNII